MHTVQMGIKYTVFSLFHWNIKHTKLECPKKTMDRCHIYRGISHNWDSNPILVSVEPANQPTQPNQTKPKKANNC